MSLKNRCLLLGFEEIYSKFADEVDHTRTLNAVKGAIIDSNRLVIVGRGQYSTYKTIKITSRELKAIRNNVHGILSQDLDRKFITAADLIVTLPQSSCSTELSKFVLYGILRDDERFFCHRYGSKIGLKGNFSASDLKPIAEIVSDILTKNGVSTANEVWKASITEGDYHIQTVTSELRLGGNTIRIIGQSYGLIGVHISRLEVLKIELASIIILSEKQEPYELDEMIILLKKRFYAVLPQTLIDIGRTVSTHITVKDNAFSLIGSPCINQWISERSCKYKVDAKELILLKDNMLNLFEPAA
jgi:hypothetical protein